jgi:hypothetical protein
MATERSKRQQRRAQPRASMSATDQQTETDFSQSMGILDLRRRFETLSTAVAALAGVNTVDDVASRFTDTLAETLTVQLAPLRRLTRQVADLDPDQAERLAALDASLKRVSWGRFASLPISDRPVPFFFAEAPGRSRQR